MSDEPQPAHDPRRHLPSVERLLANEALRDALAENGHALTADVLREVLADARVPASWRASTLRQTLIWPAKRSAGWLP